MFYLNSLQVGEILIMKLINSNSNVNPREFPDLHTILTKSAHFRERFIPCIRLLLHQQSTHKSAQVGIKRLRKKL